jgi:hypothetical protein
MIRSAACLAALLMLARSAGAQIRTPSPFPEYRADAIVGSRTSA